MAGEKKTIRQRATTRTKNKCFDPNVEPFHLRRGMEAKISSKSPFIEEWGEDYQSIFRKIVNKMQKGETKKKLSSPLQKELNCQWAWIDSLLTDAQGTIEQLKASRNNQIEDLKSDIKSGEERASQMIAEIQEALEKPTKKNQKGISKKLKGIKSKLIKNQRQKERLQKIESSERLHICFGSKKLFNAQHHLKENGYDSHNKWLQDWRKFRSGNFYSVGKGSAVGNNITTAIHHKKNNTFTCSIWVPYYLQEKYGKYQSIEFEITGHRKHDLLYALESNKPVTVQLFRREHKSDTWYIHLTTYVQDVPILHTKKNGCIGVDLNAKSVDVIYIKRDGNPGVDFNGRQIKFSFPLKDEWTSGQRKARLRDIAAQLVTLAESLNCAISLENLDFSVKKSKLRNSGSKKYNRMLSGLVYDGIRCAVLSRAEKRGVQVEFVYPGFTSCIGCFKYQQKYGLNSAFSAAMVIARIALGHKERVPRNFSSLLSLPEEREKASSGTWRKLYNLLKKNKVSRHDQFQMSTVKEVLISSLKPNRR